MDLMELVVKISAESSSFDSAIKSAEGSASSFHNTAISKIGGGLKAAAKIGVAAIGAAATAIGALTAKAVAGYSEYQQMEGGIKKLYGNMGMSLEEYAKSVGQSTDTVKSKWQSLEKAQNMVLQNASKAYATAGMSANQYMEAATSFSASLISSLGGDTVEAARLTDEAMKAMSDNWNTFGGDLNAIQGTFQSLARGNYAMLDNLKLGYGGTKAELERLISDASTYTEEQEKMNMTVDKGSMSFDNIVKAISVVQEHQNIAGTTAREATETIGGSLNMLQAAWQNLVDGFANPDADISELMGNVMDALVGYTDEAGEHVKGFADNVLPAITQAIESIGDSLSEHFPEILSMLGTLISEAAPPLIESAAGVVGQLVAAIPDMLVGVGDVLRESFGSIVETLPDTLSEEGMFDNFGQSFRDSLIEIFGSTDFTDIARSVGEGITSAFDDLSDMIQIGGQIADGALESILESAPDMIEAGAVLSSSLIEGFTTTDVSFVDVVGNIGETLISGLIDLVPSVIEAAGEIGSSLVSGFMDVSSELLNVAGEWIRSIYEGFTKNQGSILTEVQGFVARITAAFVSNAPQLLVAGAKMIANVLIGLTQALPSMMSFVLQIPVRIVNGIIQGAYEGGGRTIIQKIASGIQGAVSAVISAAKSAATSAWNAFISHPWVQAGSQALRKVVSGVVSVVGSLVSSARSAASSAGSAFTSFSWSSIGSNIISGIASGISGAVGTLVSAAVSAAQSAFNAAKNALGIKSPSKKGKELGKYFDEGIKVGLLDNIKYVSAAAADVAEGVDEAAREALDIHSPSGKGKKVGKDYAAGVTEGLKTSRADIIKWGLNAINGLVQALANKNVQKEGEALGRALSKGIKTGIKASKYEAVQATENAASAILSAAKKRLDNYKVYRDMDLQAEITYWNEIRKQIKKGTQARIDADKEYFAARDAMKKEKSEAYSDARELTADYVREMDEVKRQRREDEDELINEYNEKSHKIWTQYWKKLDDEEAKHNKKLEDLEKKHVSNLADIDDDIAKDIEKVNSKLISEIDKLNDEYEKSITSRAKKIMDFTGLFERVSYDRTYSKDYLQDTLKEQVEALEDWDSELDRLEGRVGRDNPVLKEIEEMGVSSLFTLKELNSMSDAELQDYVSLYNRKAEIANARALQEGESLRSQTDAEIAQLRSRASEEIAQIEANGQVRREALKKQYDEDLAAEIEAFNSNQEELMKEWDEADKELQEEMAKKYQEITTKAETQMQELTDQYKRDLNKLATEVKTKGKDVGTSMLAGIQKGLQDSGAIQRLADAAASAAQQAYESAKRTLGIKSPSKKFAELGKYSDEGFAKGIRDNINVVEKAMQQVLAVPAESSFVNVSGRSMEAGFVQNLTVNSPTALTPSEVARQTRLANQQMVLALNGV